MLEFFGWKNSKIYGRLILKITVDLHIPFDVDAIDDTDEQKTISRKVGKINFGYFFQTHKIESIDLRKIDVREYRYELLQEFFDLLLNCDIFRPPPNGLPSIAGCTLSDCEIFEYQNIVGIHREIR